MVKRDSNVLKRPGAHRIRIDFGHKRFGLKYGVAGPLMFSSYSALPGNERKRL